MARSLSTEAREGALEAARELLAEHGIDGFSVEEVVRRSGVAKSTIYRHWADRSELMVAALKSFMPRLPTPNTGSLRDDLVACMSDLCELAAEARLRVLFLDLLTARATDPELARVLDRMEEEHDRPVRTVLELARARGEVAADLDLDLALDVAQGPMFSRLLVRDRPMGRDDIERVADLLTAAFAPDRGGRR
jgi:AcrR family transcriptional regulator